MIPTPEQHEGWQKDYLNTRGHLSSLQRELLENGPKFLAQSWMMQRMYNEWKRMRGLEDPEPVESMREWEENIKKSQTLG